ncbi:hypothetical protein PXJ67_00485 (plasmid) [Mycobacteroides chelonae]|jgi:hypothetical protein|uniref:Uncharacterized protein n=3 Tax=Mycolicibacterium TaxID=1866885 RepID=A0A0M2K7U4_9MYCO|nr:MULTISPECIES: hypothetical protein [Mycobacteriaceae]KKF03276.1 hypothetical protein WN67_04085 [Mycolicibacterium obuense]OAN37193.1 hypothetical protein A4X20_23620 [Mycolicibacterium iranicum]PZT87201.1 MAG: hypothetical protein DI630_34445 [Gordonia sp. (in: high G+C Gram-positive bacteria)]WED89774.1 hypothetical protein PXJ67_00485 [Mycobacteroides chelonae]
MIEPIVEASSRPLGELIEDFDGIADQLIPYSQLPPRLAAYSEVYPYWRDIGAHTSKSLTAQPGIGLSALTAIIDTARRAIRSTTASHPDTTAAGAAAKLLDQLDAETRTILTTRVLPLDPKPTAQVAAMLGCAKASVSRGTRRAERKLVGLLAHPEHEALHRHAQRIAQRLGPYLPAQVAAAELAQTGQTLTCDTAALLLHTAGPYRRRLHWLENTGTRGREHVDTTAEHALTAGAGALRTTELTTVLAAAGMHPDAIDTYLTETYRHTTIADQRITHTAATTATMAAAVLHAHQRPLTIEEVRADIGLAVSPGSVATALSDHKEFARASRTTWALRTWKLPEYTSINDAIATYIDDHGGSVRTTELLKDLHTPYPDISARSLRTYLATPRYITRNGYSRRRTAADPAPASRPLNQARGMYRTNTHVIRLALPVTPELQRGSGRSIAVSVARAAHITLGGHQSFTNPDHSPITVTWVTNASNNARIGSLRTHAQQLNAAVGGTLIIAFNTHRRTYTIATLDTSAPATEQLAQFTGRDTRDPNAAMTAALDNPKSSPEDILGRRGDTDVADLLKRACVEAGTHAHRIEPS